MHKKFKNCYSPEMRLLQVYRDFYQQLHSAVFVSTSTKYTNCWRRDTYQRSLTAWLMTWTKRHEADLSRTTPTSRVHRLPPPAHLQYKAFTTITSVYVLAIIKDIKDQLHSMMAPLG
jgi:hypothetical protein